MWVVVGVFILLLGNYDSCDLNAFTLFGFIALLYCFCSWVDCDCLFMFAFMTSFYFVFTIMVWVLMCSISSDCLRCVLFDAFALGFYYVLLCDLFAVNSACSFAFILWFVLHALVWGWCLRLFLGVLLLL